MQSKNDVLERRISKMTRDELKRQIDELMAQYDNEEIDGATYAQEMIALTSSYQDRNQDD